MLWKADGASTGAPATAGTVARARTDVESQDGVKPVASTQAPSESELNDFLGRLRTYRGTLSGTHQALLDAMVAAALGRTQPQEAEDEVKPFWYAYAAGPYGGGYSVGGPYGGPTVGWQATPWGAAYGVRYW